MRASVACLALLVLMPAPAAAQSLPAGVRQAVAALGDAILVTAADVDRRACKGKPRTQLVAVSGDFDGDGRRDWALYVRSPGVVDRLLDRTPPRDLYDVQFVFAMARANGRYEIVTVRQGRETLPLYSYLLLQPAGPIREVPFEDNPTPVVLRNPGVMELYCGQASSTYFWDPELRAFRYIVTGD
jgi:hypothetical protein